MTIPEAVSLVIEAGALAKGGEIFILDMGKPVRIVDLAEDLIRSYGLEPYKDIKIEFTGIRPGEKLFEELLTMEEGSRATKHDRIYVGKPLDLTYNEVQEGIKDLEEAISKEAQFGEENLRTILKQLVPSYNWGDKAGSDAEVEEALRASLEIVATLDQSRSK